MFIENPFEPQKPEISLLKPDRTIISHLPEMYGWEHELKLGQISLLTFNIPFKVSVRGAQKHNKNIALMKPRYQIRYRLGNFTEYFVIQKTTIVHDENSDYVKVECAGLPIQLADKKIVTYSATSKNATQLLNDMLVGSSWGIGSIAAEYDTKFRGFEFTGNVADAISEISELFQALLIYDSVNKTVNFYKPSQYGMNKGFEVSREKLLKSITYESNSTEQITRLYVRGAEGVSINSVTSTGVSWLENFDYFLQNGYMSSSLSTALIHYIELKHAKEAQFNGYLATLDSLNSQLSIKNGELSDLQSELDVLLDTRDLKNSQQQDVTATLDQIASKKAQIASKHTEISALTAQIDSVNDDIHALAEILSIENNLSSHQSIELDNFIVEGEYENQYISDPLTLKNEAIAYFNDLLAPKLIVEIDLVNLFEALEFQNSPDLDKVVLGDFINIKYDLSNLYVTARIMEIKTSENGSINITISNITKGKADEEKWVDELRTSMGSARAFSMSKYAYDNAAHRSTEIQQTLENTWSAIDRKISGGYNNQVTWDGRGLIIRDPSDPNRMLIAQNGVLALSKDGGNHWASAVTADGVIAERVYGTLGAFAQVSTDHLIVGSNPIADELIASSSEWNAAESNAKQYTDSQVLNINTQISEIASDSKLTPSEKQQTKLTWDGIVAEKPTIEAEATTFSITTEKTGYTNAYNALSTYITPLLTDLTTTSDIVGSTFRQKFTDYFDKRTLLLKAISEKAKTLADNAQTSANTANSLISDISNDNKLTPVEKSSIKLEWDTIVSEKTIIESQATTYSITTEKTNYVNSYNTLNTYITPLLSNLATTSDIVGSTFRTNFKDYYDKRTTLLKVISEKSKTLADNAQSTANNAWGKFSGAGNTLPAGNVEFNFANSTSKGGNATNTDNVGNQPAGSVQNATVNFNNRNDRNSTTPANPTIASDGTAIDHTINTDGSADISFEWTYNGTGNAYDIDGFIVYGNQSSSSSAYTFGSNVGNEQVFYVTPEKRAFILYGVPANKYYTFGVQAYRIVDQDINSAGVLKSGIVKSSASGENPYQPSSSVAFAGNVTGTINGSSAATVASNANNSVQQGTLYNGVIINTANGLVVTRSDNKSRAILNATDGLKIQSSTNGTTWTDKISADTNGQIIAEDLVTNRIIMKNGNDVLIDANNRIIDFSKFTTKYGNITAANIDASNLYVSSANVTGLITAGQLNVKGGIGGVTTLLNGYNDTFGGKLAIYDNNGFTNVRVGVEAGGAGVGNTGGTLVLYNDAPSNVVGFSNKQRVEIAISGSGDYGFMNLRNTNGNATISIEADSGIGTYMGIRTGTDETLKTWLTATTGFINFSEILTRANINTVPITAKFK